MDYFKKYNSAIPKYLFHYTTPLGLVGIANSQKLWATNSQYLNDNKEIRHSVDIASERIGAALFGHSPDFVLDEGEKKFFEVLFTRLNKHESQVFVVSLTTEKDLLSQWRGYCTNGGYSIGFPDYLIANSLHDQQFRLSKCIYNDKIKIEIVKNLLLDYLSKFRENADSKTNNDQLFDRLLEDFFSDFSQISPFLKHASFSEEKEWRLISNSRSDYTSKLKFRGNTQYVIPYIEFDLCLSEKKLKEVTLQKSPIVIIASPSNHMKIAANSARLLFQEKWGICESRISSIPFRS